MGPRCFQVLGELDLFRVTLVWVVTQVVPGVTCLAIPPVAHLVRVPFKALREDSLLGLQCLVAHLEVLHPREPHLEGGRLDTTPILTHGHHHRPHLLPTASQMA